MTWPGWNSITDASWWSGLYFWLGIGALALLGVFEAGSHAYSLRKYELSASEEDSTKRSHDEEMAHLHVLTASLEKDAEEAKAKIADADARAAEANARALEARAELEKFRSPRVIKPDQAENIIRVVSKWATLPANGEAQSAAVFPVDSSFESASLADQIAAVLGIFGAKWSINRNSVTYGKMYSVSGVGILTSKNPRGNEVANDLAEVLTANGIMTFVVPEKRGGCEEMEQARNRVDTDPWCSAISVMVGEHPRR